jgi:hypothetical protein
MAMKIVEAEVAAGVIKDDLDGSRLRSVKSRFCRKVSAALRSTNSEK